MIEIVVNGTTERVAEGATVRQLLASRNLAPEKVAIELNRRLLRSDRYDTVLEQDDAVEIVTFVGGG